MSIEYSAMRWLWLEKKCHYILEQRTPRYNVGIPDVIGVTLTRHIIEIEIKRTVSDFKADKGKHHRINRDLFIDQQPKEFYYLVPYEIAEKIEPLLPPWAGLMTFFDGVVAVKIKSPVNAQSKRLSLKECVKMCRCMVNHMMAYKTNLEGAKNNFMHRDDQWFTDWVRPEDGSYNI